MGCRKAARATRRRRHCCRQGSKSSSSFWSRCTSSGARTLCPRDDACRLQPVVRGPGGAHERDHGSRGRARGGAAGARRHGRDRRLPQRGQVDPDQPSHAEPSRGRARDAGRHTRSQGAPLRMDGHLVPADRHGRCRRRRRRPLRSEGRRPGARGDRRRRPRALRRRRSRGCDTRATRSWPRSCAPPRRR